MSADSNPSISNNGPVDSVRSASPPLLPDNVRRSVYVLVPAYNEESCVGAVVESLIDEYPNVVVVDDGSGDRTASEASEAGASVLRHAVNRGQGASIQTAIDYALMNGAEYLVTFDSDGQHQVGDVAALLVPIVDGQWDISLGSRFIGQAEGMTASRGVMLRCGVLFTRFISRVDVTDTHNGLRAFSRRAAEKIDITLDRMAHASELFDQIRETDLPYGEVPVSIKYTEYSRAKGQSGLGALKILFHYFFGRVSS